MEKKLATKKAKTSTKEVKTKSLFVAVGYDDDNDPALSVGDSIEGATETFNLEHEWGQAVFRIIKILEVPVELSRVKETVSKIKVTKLGVIKDNV